MVSKLIVLCLMISTVLIGLAAANEPKKEGYETKYDNIDLDELLKNDRLRKNYVKCLLNEGPCTPDAQELKSSLPDAIATNCSKCTEKQRSGSEKVTHYLIDNQPEEWDQLAVIYDKDGEYKRKYIESKMHEPNATDPNGENDKKDDETEENERNEQPEAKNKPE
ncbi:ejaculatory bulb-specific protein 3-like [Sitodiplosis mosellana]|uniref:ejaculatory bulb-specific protein 3-like n=1 Tax=Sitodiplosis mosellana TaxID=263140 RepID=UPI0024446C04|nr:ejaculatory bulb-specific protein 3-like [Sitodiplosis mosellana]